MTLLTDAEKTGLSAEEIKALEDDEGDDLDTLLPVDEKPEAEVAEDPEADKSFDDSKPGDGPAFIPLPVVPQEELASLKQAYDDALQKFDDGDIDYAELDEAKDAYNQAKWKSEFARETNQSIVTGRWEREQESFLNTNTDYRDNPALNAAFVTAVNRLIETDEGRAMSDRQVLEAARRKVEKDLGIVGNSRTRARADADMDISDDETENQSNDFAYLDKLEGAAFQAAIDKLTPAQLKRYEDSQ